MKIYINKEIKTEIDYLDKTENKAKSFKWHYYYIIHHIVTYRIINSKYKNSEYIPISVKKLRTKISYDKASKFLKQLVKYNIIETDHNYISGTKSKGYKIANRFKLDNFKFLKVEDEKLKVKLEYQIKNELVGGYKIVTENFKQLSLDFDSASIYLDNNFSKELRFFYKMSISMFENRFSLKDSVCNRLHNNLTNLPTCLRSFLSYENDFLYQVDIKCSQPTFLGLYAIKTGFCSLKDIEEYMEDCKTGVFYDKFSDLKETKDRKELKKLVFKNCFFNNTNSKLSEYEKRFKELYPVIFKLIVILKSKDYRNLSITLQREESLFVFNTVEKLKCYVLTIHDSFLCKCEDIEYVKNVIKQNFIEKYGFEPKLEEEKC